MNRTTLFRAAVSAVGLAGLVLAGPGAAFAAGTYVSVNGSTAPGTVAYTAANDTSTIKFNTNYGTEVSCTSVSFDGDIKRGVEVTPSNVIGTIDSMVGDCSMSIITMSVTMTGGDIEVRTDPANAGDPVGVTITDIHLQFA